MKQIISLSPQELYYLGTLLQAKYIDYAYVAAMEDIKNNYSLYEAETSSSLVSAGILLEDFSGNIELEKTAEKLLRPVFFGEFEACVDICTVGEEHEVKTLRFHVLDGMITMITNADGRLSAEAIDQVELLQLIAGILPQHYSCAVPEITDVIPKESVSRMIAVKNTWIGKSSTVRLYVEANGRMYHEKENGLAESMTADMFTNEVLRLLKGV